MHCIDTNLAIDILRGDLLIKSKVQKLSEQGDVYITPVSLCELYKGAYGSKRMQVQLPIIEQFSNVFGIADFNTSSCKEFGRLFAYLNRKGKIISEPDLMIAAISKANNLILITRDKDFLRTGIQVEMW